MTEDSVSVHRDSRGSGEPGATAEESDVAAEAGQDTFSVNRFNVREPLDSDRHIALLDGARPCADDLPACHDCGLEDAVAARDNEVAMGRIVYRASITVSQQVLVKPRQKVDRIGVVRVPDFESGRPIIGPVHGRELEVGPYSRNCGTAVSECESRPPGEVGGRCGSV